MRYSVMYSILLLLLPLLVWGQQDVEVKRERIFTGSGLYGFMNGGAEQFLEYGVTRLTARDVVYKGENYSVEIYEMPSAEDAFGIYSLHIFKCQRADMLGCLDCLSPYQLQAVVGNKYASVVFPSGSEGAKEAADELLCLYLPMDDKDDPKIPELLAVSAPYSGVVKYLKGPISVSGVSTSLAALVKNIPYSCIWFVAGKEVDSYRALIYMSDNTAATELQKRLTSSDILEQGKDFFYIKGVEKEEASDEHDDFGF